KRPRNQHQDAAAPGDFNLIRQPLANGAGARLPHRPHAGSCAMSFTMTNTVRKVRDHFEPEPQLDPQEQRALRAHLEQIDYAAFAANKEVLAKAIDHADPKRFQRLAIAAAQARGRWVAAAIALAEKQEAPTPA